MYNRGKKIFQGYKQIWKSKSFIVFLFVIIIFIGVSVSKEVLRRLETKYEVDKLENEVERLTQRNQEATNIISYLNTSSYQDKEARIKLGLQMQNEHVIYFQNQKVNSDITLPHSDKIQYLPIRDYQSNPEKWFYFFWDKVYNIS